MPSRIRARIAVDPGGCWHWIGAITGSGYGSTWWDGRNVVAHRLTFHLLADTSLVVRPGHNVVQLDHLCRVRRCVNPAHLEVVDNRTNYLRGQRRYRRGPRWSDFTGVSWASKRWNAAISVAGKIVYLGNYTDESAAARAYDAAAVVLHGDATNYRAGLLDAAPSSIALDVARARLARARGPVVVP